MESQTLVTISHTSTFISEHGMKHILFFFKVNILELRISISKWHIFMYLNSGKCLHVIWVAWHMA